MATAPPGPPGRGPVDLFPPFHAAIAFDSARYEAELIPALRDRLRAHSGRSRIHRAEGSGAAPATANTVNAVSAATLAIDRAELQFLRDNGVRIPSNRRNRNTHPANDNDDDDDDDDDDDECYDADGTGLGLSMLQMGSGGAGAHNASRVAPSPYTQRYNADTVSRIAPSPYMQRYNNAAASGAHGHPAAAAAAANAVGAGAGAAAQRHYLYDDDDDDDDDSLGSGLFANPTAAAAAHGHGHGPNNAVGGIGVSSKHLLSSAVAAADAAFVPSPFPVRTQPRNATAVSNAANSNIGLVTPAKRPLGPPLPPPSVIMPGGTAPAPTVTTSSSSSSSSSSSTGAGAGAAAAGRFGGLPPPSPFRGYSGPPVPHPAMGTNTMSTASNANTLYDAPRTPERNGNRGGVGASASKALLLSANSSRTHSHFGTHGTSGGGAGTGGAHVHGLLSFPASPALACITPIRGRSHGSHGGHGNGAFTMATPTALPLPVPLGPNNNAGVANTAAFPASPFALRQNSNVNTNT